MAERAPRTLLGVITGSVLLALGLGASLIWLGAEYYLGGESRVGPAQPIPFSHRLHVETTPGKDIDCRFCHTGVHQSQTAGIPPVETCLFCHSNIITEHEEIRLLQSYADGDLPLDWVRVFEVPDHVYFPHRIHTGEVAELPGWEDAEGGAVCTNCHGPIDQMDRIYEYNDFQMQFCLDCHRTRGAAADCLTCHQ